MSERFKVFTFYGFRDMNDRGPLESLRDELREVMRELDVVGTMILAREGFNSTVCGLPGDVSKFVERAGVLLGQRITGKTSFCGERPFRRIDVKIKPEIVTLKKPVEISLGAGTHVAPREWNAIISDPDVLVLDTRNDYEYKTGTFAGAVNPGTEKFSELPDFVAENLDPEKHKKIAMFCTGGIRCEKFVPYMKGLGFREVYQLEGGILKYLEEIPAGEQLWQGDCYVFDTRVSVDKTLEPGTAPDLSISEE